jgi:hypothetical protein
MIKLLFKHHKIIGIVTSLLFAMLVFAVTAWFTVNYYLIPKVVVPQIQEYIKNNLPEDVSLAIKDISFDVFHGFHLHDVNLTSKVVLKNSNAVLSAREIDIDLAIVPLFKRRIDIVSMELYGANMRIGRTSEGKWNCDSLFKFVNKMNCSEKDKLCSFSVGEFMVRNSSVEYVDVFSKDNQVEKKFADVNVSYRNSAKNIYSLLLDGHIAGSEAEPIGITINYDTSQNKLSGVLKFRLASLTDYWDYYLDHLFSPWNLSGKDVGINFSFVYENNVFLLDGQYTLGKGSLRYGKLNISGKAVVNHLFTIKNGVLEKDTAIVSVNLENGTVSAGENNILEKGMCKAEITGKGIDFKDLSGLLFEFPVAAQGQFIFGSPNELALNGRFVGADNEFNLKLISNNQADALWKIKNSKSELVVSLKMDDIENLQFKSDVKGRVFLNDIIKNFDIVSGGIDVVGNLFGNADDISSLNGSLKVLGENLIVLNESPSDFDISAEIKNGILNGGLRKVKFCNGEAEGFLYIDQDLWAGALNVDYIDLMELSKMNLNLQGIKGFLTGSFVCGAGWDAPASITGGGYLKLEDAYVWSAPVFSEINKGMTDVKQISSLEKFNLLEGNYAIEKNGISIENVFCNMPSIKMNIKGNILFDGTVSFVVGVVFSAISEISNLHNILMPHKIFSDFVASCADIHIEGKWPVLEHTTEMHPFSFFNSLFPLTGERADPDKYSLEEYLTEHKKSINRVSDLKT